MLVFSGKSLVEFGRVRAESGRFRATFGLMWPVSIQSWSKSGQSRQNSGQFWAMSSQLWWNGFGRIRPLICRFRQWSPLHQPNWMKFGRVRPQEHNHPGITRASMSPALASALTLATRRCAPHGLMRRAKHNRPTTCKPPITRDVRIPPNDKSPISIILRGQTDTCCAASAQGQLSTSWFIQQLPMDASC